MGVGYGMCVCGHIDDDHAMEADVGEQHCLEFGVKVSVKCPCKQFEDKSYPHPAERR